MTAEDKHNIDKQFLIESLAQELIAMLIESYGWDIPKAMDVLYSSKTFEKLERETTGLYYQGAVYVYDILSAELKQVEGYF